ncbi:hypothetical protein BB559_007342 [Furculomyces boomerangus]|uniref:Protein transport protein Sec61 subunit beta n=2 Tax=Harpellales TaxID=61421 RepID=A0A2T9XXQ7_9FUNG|nr:hypothetical protein BB559_007342 [Furculomyces boomerangus]PWA01021.1 hypothetical protein BB558_002909 [Smittium angustum]
MSLGPAANSRNHKYMQNNIWAIHHLPVYKNTVSGLNKHNKSEKEVVKNSGTQSGSVPRNVRARRGASQAARANATTRQVSKNTGSTRSMLRLYTDDSPGLRVDPVVLMVMCLVFIASVFLLHLYGKFTRG